ncbi:hypothetical protein M569_14733, partial [Genlisea aurea]
FLIARGGRGGSQCGGRANSAPLFPSHGGSVHGYGGVRGGHGVHGHGSGGDGVEAVRAVAAVAPRGRGRGRGRPPLGRGGNRQQHDGPRPLDERRVTELMEDALHRFREQLFQQIPPAAGFDRPPSPIPDCHANAAEDSDAEWTGHAAYDGSHPISLQTGGPNNRRVAERGPLWRPPIEHSVTILSEGHSTCVIY